jgi:tight adherence protein C
VPDPIVLGYVGTLLVLVAVAMLVYAFVPQQVDQEEIYGYRETKRKRLLNENELYAVTLPLVKIFTHYIRMIPEGAFGPIDNLRADLREKLPRSGYIGALSSNEFLGMCCTVGLGAFVFTLGFTAALNGIPNLGVSVIAMGVGTVIPFLQLNSSIQDRLQEIDRRLPYVMDLLVLSMSAGLDFMTALDRVVARGREQNPEDPMIQELGVVQQEMQVGTPRAEALKNMCERVESEYLDSMVGSIIQAEKRGTPLAQVLEIQIDTIRNKRTQKVEKQASEASVKILLPLMFIFAAVIVVILGAMVLQMSGGGA